LNILLVSATAFEMAPLLQWLEQHAKGQTEGAFQVGNHHITPLVTGVGMVATAFHLGRVLTAPLPHWAMNIGIAGAFDPQLSPGDVVQVHTERFGDLGVEEADGRFTDFFDLGLIPNDGMPFTKGVLRNPYATGATFLSAVEGLTVQKVHGFGPSIEQVRQRYPEAQIESMEGAAFFYACLHARIPFMEIRGISNYVEPRNRAAWQIPKAIQHVNEVAIKMIETIGNE
jgi:futalosine hydrolase